MIKTGRLWLLASHTGSLPAKLPGLRWIPPPPGSDFDVSIFRFWVSPNTIQKGQFNLETQVQKIYGPWTCWANLATGKSNAVPPCSPCPAVLHLTNRGQALRSGDYINSKPVPTHSDRPLLQLRLEHEEFCPPGVHSECVGLRQFLAGGLRYVSCSFLMMNAFNQSWRHQSLDYCDIIFPSL